MGLARCMPYIRIIYFNWEGNMPNFKSLDTSSNTNFIQTAIALAIGIGIATLSVVSLGILSL